MDILGWTPSLAIMVMVYGDFTSRMSVGSGKVLNSRKSLFDISIPISMQSFIAPASWPPVIIPWKNKNRVGMTVRTLVSFS